LEKALGGLIYQDFKKIPTIVSGIVTHIPFPYLHFPLRLETRNQIPWSFEKRFGRGVGQAPAVKSDP
jgi:hypothetical protein